VGQAVSPAGMQNAGIPGAYLFLTLRLWRSLPANPEMSERLTPGHTFLVVHRRLAGETACPTEPPDLSEMR